MTAIPPSSEPPFGADTDEAVSALLDGDLGAFATDHGLAEADARARLDAWPGLEERRAALAGAAAAIAAPEPALDDLTRRRLVRDAVDARATPAGERRSRRWTAIGAVAAGLLAVVGVGLALNASSDGGGSSNDAASSAGSVAPDLRGDIGYVGDLSGPDALRDVLTGKRDAESAQERAANNADDATGTGGDECASCSRTSDQSGTPEPTSSLPSAAARSAAPPLSPADCAAQLAGKRPVTFVGSATYQGVPVTVVGLTERGRVIAFLVPSNDCTDVLTSVSR
jgi:hypothetical protein